MEAAVDRLVIKWRSCFRSSRPTEPGEAGRQIDAGSVTLHPIFMSLMTSW
jgi:hypothetical protein